MSKICQISASHRLSIAKERLRVVIRSITRNHFIASCTILAGGTTLAQLLSILVSPLQTRLYGPEQFALQAVFSSILITLAPIFCGRYDEAVGLPKSDRHALQVIGICFWFGIALGVLLQLLLVLAPDEVLNVFHANGLKGFAWLIPLAAFSNALCNALLYLANRGADYKVIAKSKLLSAIAFAIISISLGFFLRSESGLVTATIASSFIGTAILLLRYPSVLSTDCIRWSSRKCVLIKRYWRFPVYNATSALLAGLTLVMPIFFLSRHYSDSAVGSYSLLIRVINAPLFLIAAAVSQVNFKKVVDLIHKGIPVRPYIKRLTLVLIAIAVVPITLITFFGESLFGTIFGERWEEAGQYAQIIVISQAVRFISTTLGGTMIATRQIGLSAAWKYVSFLTTLGVYSLMSTSYTIRQVLWAAAAVDCLLYLAHFYLIWHATGRNSLKGSQNPI